jgi:hypothetical protein
VVQVSGAGQQIKVIFGKVKGQGKKKDKESSRPEESHLAFKQLNVLIVITFHIHGNIIPYRVSTSVSLKGFCRNLVQKSLSQPFECVTKPVQEKTGGSYLDKTIFASFKSPADTVGDHQKIEVSRRMSLGSTTKKTGYRALFDR